MCIYISQNRQQVQSAKHNILTFPRVAKSSLEAVAALNGLRAGGIHQKHTFTKLRGCDSTKVPPEDCMLCSKCFASIAL